MTRWTIDGRGDTGTRATHYQSGKRYEFNVQRLSDGFWLSELTFMDGSTLQLAQFDMSEAGAQARCEFRAANMHEGI